MSGDDRALKTQAARIDTLLGELESFPDPALRAAAVEIVQGLVALYGEGLARMLALVGQRSAGPEGERLLEAFAGDELVAHLLLLHDLHPVDLHTRVARALEEVRPYLQSHGGNVELLGIDDGVAHLRLQGSCHGCPSSTVTLKLAIEEAIAKAAPDLEGIEAEGAVAPPPAAHAPYGDGAFVPLSTVRRREQQAPAPICPVPVRRA
ncbi:MAG: hypothetical protein NVSMB65_17610 [Chloroflexota bacterium]